MNESFLQCVPQYIGLLLTVNYDFRDYPKNLRKINRLKI